MRDPATGVQNRFQTSAHSLSTAREFPLLPCSSKQDRQDRSRGRFHQVSEPKHLLPTSRRARRWFALRAGPTHVTSFALRRSRNTRRGSALHLQQESRKAPAL